MISSRYLAQYSLFGTLPLLLGLMIAPGSFAEQRQAEDNVTFIVIGKKDHYRQDENGNLELLSYFLFTDVVLTRDGKMDHATFTAPNGTRTFYPEVHGRKSSFGMHFGQRQWMDLAFPDGDFVIDISTPDGNVDGLTLSLSGADFPGTALVTLKQNSKAVPVNKVDPDQDLKITWTPFKEGRDDRNPVLEDIIFVAVHDCENNQIGFGGRPRDGTPYLNYKDTEFPLSADKLEPGRKYALFVEHAILTDIDQSTGIFGIASFAPTTYLDFATTGKNEGKECPATMPQLEQGQIDRMLM